VRHAGVQVQFDRDAGSAEGERVPHVFVPEDIELADLDVGGWESAAVEERAGAEVGGTSSPPARSPSNALQPVTLSS
jgi:hypothetical protein